MDEMYEMAFQLILTAGNSKSESMIAISCAREGKFEEVQEHLQKAKAAFSDAHQVQTDLLSNEAGGEKKEINIMLVHAQDHLCMALMAYENAKEMLEIYKLLYQLKEKEEH